MPKTFKIEKDLGEVSCLFSPTEEQELKSSDSSTKTNQ